MSADLILTLTLSIFWLAIYKFFPFLRREMWLTGLFGTLLLPITFFILIDIKEFSPIYSLISTAFVFLTSSLSGVIFHALVGLDYNHIKESRKNRHQSELWLAKFIFTVIAFSWLSIIFHLIFAISTSASLLTSAFIIFLYIIADRRDLLIDSVLSAFLMTFISFTAGLLSIMITTDFDSILFSKDTLFGLPADLLVFSFALGLGLGPIYEYSRLYTLTQHDSR
jgi:hypothetical protein